MKNYLTIFLVTLVLNSCAQMKVESPAFDSVIKPIVPTQVELVSVKGVTDSLNKDQVVFLDAREKSEFEVSHIKDAIWIGYNDFSIERLNGIDRSKTIVVYCSVGYRSGKVGEQIIAQGYDNVLNLYGGIFEWTNEGNEVVNKDGLTNEVHGYDAKWGVFLKNAKVVLP